MTPSPAYPLSDNRRLCAVGTLTVRREGRNNQGMRVLAARCVCGWVHMTAYPLFHKRSRAKYLRRRFTDHLYESWVTASGPDRPLDMLCGPTTHHWPGSSSSRDIERDECACGTPLVICSCGDQRCFRCDPVTGGSSPDDADATHTNAPVQS